MMELDVPLEDYRQRRARELRDTRLRLPLLAAGMRVTHAAIGRGPRRRVNIGRRLVAVAATLIGVLVITALWLIAMRYLLVHL